MSLERGTKVQTELPQVDITFVFDTTGSMSDKIDGLVACTTDFVDQLVSLGLDWRVTCIPFGDLTIPGDGIETSLPFVRDAEAAKQQLRSMPRFSGGGNLGESSIEAMLAAFDRPWRSSAVRVLVLLTDEPALDAHRHQQIAARLREAEMICFCAAPGLDYYKSWAEENGGHWYAIGASMNTAGLLDLLRHLVRDVATVAARVHELAAGSAARYLELESGDA